MAESKAKKQYHLGTGRRKTSVARVRLIEGTGKIEINGRKLEEYFTEDRDRGLVTGPLEVTDMRNRFDLFADVKGGGFAGQAGAICQGVARALKIIFGPDTPAPSPAADGAAPAEPTAAAGLHKKLRDSGYLTRDGRMKERKKYGRKGARKSFQFSKR